MRFAIKTKNEHTTWDAMLDVWREADRIELFESGWNFDHYYPINGDTAGPCLEAWVTLSALAQATERIRLGTLVNGIVYRHPAVLANMAATLDIVSNGRLELGLGTGWAEEECEAYGIDLGPWPRRFDRFEEALQIVTGLLSDDQTTLEGEYYSVIGARCEPKGPQRPHPPICIGGVGEKRTLPLVARYAQHWNHMMATPDDLRQKLEVLDRLCDEIGRDRSEITVSSHIFVPDEPDPPAVAADVAALEEAGLELAILYLPVPHEASTLEPLAEALAPLN